MLVMMKLMERTEMDLRWNAGKMKAGQGLEGNKDSWEDSGQQKR